MLATALALTLFTAPRPEVMSINVQGVDRQAFVAYGTAQKDAPLVFAFHGHGGNMRYAARKYRIHELWPEATVVYMQGLPTAGRTDPEGKKNGWDLRGDRDLLFFDTVYKKLTEQGGYDKNQVYSMGHSNGGGMTYILWGKRADKFAAVAPFSAAGARMGGVSSPVAAFIVGGKSDPLVTFREQKASMDIALKVNGAKLVSEKGFLASYEGTNGADVQTYLFDGGHEFAEAAVPLMVDFFRAHRKVSAPD